MKHSDITTILSQVERAIPTDYERKYFRFHIYRYQYILQKIATLSLPPQAKILDVGCYPLHMFTALKKMGYQLYGISSPHEPIKAPNIAVVNIEKDHLPFKDGFFDLILFSEIMEHLLISPLVYLSEFHRVLSATGKLIITTPNAAGMHKIIPLLMGRSTYFPLSDALKSKLDDGSLYHRHNREYTQQELRQVLEQAGFQVAAAGQFNAYRSYERQEAQGKPGKMLARRITFGLTQAYSRLRDTLYVEAGKQNA